MKPLNLMHLTLHAGISINHCIMSAKTIHKQYITTTANVYAKISIGRNLPPIYKLHVCMMNSQGNADQVKEKCQ